MIMTVTPNPTIDRAVFVRNFRLGTIMRGEREVLTPSGKGVDASLVLHALGVPTLTTGLQAGRAGRLAIELLDALGIPNDFVWAEGETRHALVLIDLEAHAQSTISASTLRANQGHLDALAATVERHLAAASFVVLAGSLPPGWPSNAYITLIAICRKAGVPTLLDTSGAALAAVLGENSAPDIIKVNAVELAGALTQWPQLLVDAQLLETLSGPRPDLTHVAQAAATLRQRIGNRAVMVTLGAQGSVAATDEGIWQACPPQVEVLNDAGAGDALAGCVAWGRAQGFDWPDTLKLATAAAAAVVTTPGTAECDHTTVMQLRDLVEINEL